MKSIGKAAEFLRKAVGALRGKATVLRARLLFLASLRRRMAVVAGISRHIRALTPRQGQARDKAAAQCQGTAVVATAEDDADDENVVGLPVPELARLFEQVADEDGHGGYAEWALTLRSLFDDDEDSELRAAALPAVDGLHDDDVGQEEEPSVIDVIRSRLEGDGREFRIEDEIDRAADMYIARVRRRIMNAHTAGDC
ncbi:uncharacterized protein LOC120679552 [Panicum virgatum]|uniref:Uncharacterized protein n=1 Tax=Panicum virgatum TaxID=38727 RepID=A0A8T0R5E0_PANVG|nr:uncharacterized protein LOC120679552 [Panicum virgatum]KAG2580355.1 hypothetical protein PVAP13_6NG336000 [Panicum virgatum]